MKLVIEEMDQLGNGIGYNDGKVVFVKGAITGDVVNVKITDNKKSFMRGEIKEIITPSEMRIKPACPYFEKCGGCQLLNMNYYNTLLYKKKRVSNILKPLNLNMDIEIIENEDPFYYRNKIELKVVDGKIGYYESLSHSLIEIKECKIAKECINDFLHELSLMKIKNGDITLRANYNDELLVIIKSEDKISFKDDYSEYKVVGIVLNDETVYGENFFMEKINDFYFKVSYDAFFQVNSLINSKLFNIISKYVDDKVVLDLYSGVGTLSLAASKKALKVYAIELVENAVLDSMANAKMNNCDNVSFILGKVEDKITRIENKIDTVIVDPPRKGLDNKTMDIILKKEYDNIIYFSCETQHLKNDLEKLLDKYTLKKIYCLDMFSYTYHCESVCILERR